VKKAIVPPLLVLAFVSGLPCSASGQQTAEPVPIRTEFLGSLLETRKRDAPATTVPRDAPELASEITARIETLPVRVGDLVTQGSAVATLDCRLAETRLSVAKATLAQLVAQRDFSASQLRRSEGLKAKRGISDELVEQRASELQSLEAQHTAQQASVDQALIEVENCTVKAPFDAVVVERLASVGELATPGTPLLRLVAAGDLEIRADLPEYEASAVLKAEAISFEYQENAYDVTLRALVPVMDERSRTREGRFVLNERTTGIPAGAAGRLAWSDPTPVLPAQFVVRRQGLLGILILNGEQARFHPLPDALEGQPARVDLPVDTRLITEGRHGLIDGDRLKDSSNRAAPRAVQAE
jgi:RND family efflux transporter MFP subunit